MSRDFAKVSPRYWTGRLAQHVRDSESPSDAHAVAFYLMTNDHANMIGLYRCPVSYIVEDTGCPIEGASKGLTVLEEGAFVVLDRGSGHVWIRNSLRLELTGKSGTLEDLKGGDKRLPAVRKTAREFVAFPIYRKFYDFYCGDLGEYLPEPSSPTEGASKPHGKPHRRTEQEQEQETQQKPDIAAEAALPAQNRKQKRIADWFAREGMDPPTHKTGKSKDKPNYGVTGRWLKECGGDAGRVIEILRELQAREKIPAPTWNYAWTMMKTWGADGPPTSSNGGRRKEKAPEMDRTPFLDTPFFEKR